MARPTLHDVAAAAGVHTATASRALNAATRSRVNRDTADRVLAAAERLGYVPDPVARSLKTSRSRLVGLVVPDITTPAYPPLIRAVDRRLEAAGYDLAIVDTDNDPRRERRLITSLLRRKVDGLLVATTARPNPVLEDLHADGVPVVFVKESDDGLDAPAVTVDDDQGMTLVVAHLAGLGHRRLATVGGPATSSTAARRSRAFDLAVRDRDLESRLAWRVAAGGWGTADGRAAMAAVLEGPGAPGFTAVVAANDLLAMGAGDALTECGLMPGRDVSITGFDELDHLDRLAVPLTSVRAPVDELGDRAAGLLLDLVKDGERGTSEMSVELPMEVIPRASSGPPPAP